MIDIVKTLYEESQDNPDDYRWKAAREIELLREYISSIRRQKPVAWCREKDRHGRRKLSFEAPTMNPVSRWHPLYERLPPNTK